MITLGALPPLGVSPPIIDQGAPPPHAHPARSVAAVGALIALTSLAGWGISTYQANICDSVVGKNQYTQIKCVDAKMAKRMSKHVAIVGGVVGAIGLAWMGVDAARGV